MRIVVGHPSPSVVEGLATALANELGASVTTAVTLPALREAVRRGQELAVIDVELGPGEAITLCDELVGRQVRPVLVVRPGGDTHLALLEHGAAGIAVATDGLPGILGAVRTVLQGHVHLPAHLLGQVLHELILERRQDRAVSPPPRLDTLSPREREVLGLLGSGADTREIAAHLVISPYTAKTHVNRVLAKLGVTSRNQAARLAVEHGVHPSLMEVRSD